MKNLKAGDKLRYTGRNTQYTLNNNEYVNVKKGDIFTFSHYFSDGKGLMFEEFRGWDSPNKYELVVSTKYTLPDELFEL